MSQVTASWQMEGSTSLCSTEQVCLDSFQPMWVFKKGSNKPQINILSWAQIQTSTSWVPGGLSS